MYHSFVGIDISKNDFAICVHGNNKVAKYANTQLGFELLLSDYPMIDANSLVVLETTGRYEKALLSVRFHRVVYIFCLKYISSFSNGVKLSMPL